MQITFDLPTLPTFIMCGSISRNTFKFICAQTYIYYREICADDYSNDGTLILIIDSIYII